MMTPTTRAILYWYIRFDVSVGLLGGFGTCLPREWSAYAVDFYKLQTKQEPDNLQWKIEVLLAQIRLLAMDASVVFAKKGKGQITHEEFLQENAVIGQRLEDWKTNMDPALRDQRYLVKDFTGCPPLHPDDIVNPYQPNMFFRGPLYPVNLAWLGWFEMDIMHRYQTALMTGQQPGADIAQQAYKGCQLVEAVEYWPESPNGKLLGLHACLGLSALFLPKDERHAMWFRRKYAKIECEGYVVFYISIEDTNSERRC